MSTKPESFNEVLTAARVLCAKYDAAGAGHAAQPIRDLVNRLSAAHDREAGDMAWALVQILGDMPQQRDWLDPNLQSFAENAIDAFSKGHHAHHDVPLVGFKPKAWFIPSTGRVTTDLGHDPDAPFAHEAKALYTADQLLNRDHHHG